MSDPFKTVKTSCSSGRLSDGPGDQDTKNLITARPSLLSATRHATDSLMQPRWPSPSPYNPPAPFKTVKTTRSSGQLSDGPGDQDTKNLIRGARHCSLSAHPTLTARPSLLSATHHTTDTATQAKCQDYILQHNIDSEDPSSSAPLLRAVIHQTHSFLIRFLDPSLFFSRPATSQASHSKRSGSPDSLLEADERPWYQTGTRGAQHQILT